MTAETACCAASGERLSYHRHREEPATKLRSNFALERRRDPGLSRDSGLLRREELLAMTRRAPSIFRGDHRIASAEEAVVDADLGDVAGGALGLVERRIDGGDAVINLTRSKWHAPAQITDAVEFELGAPIRCERVFKAGAEQQSSQDGAAVLKIAGTAVILRRILRKIEPARGDSGLAVNQRAADRDARARGEIGAPAVSAGELVRRSNPGRGRGRSIKHKIVLESGPRRFAFHAPD